MRVIGQDPRAQSHKDHKKAIASASLNLDDLMAKSCERSHDYLSINPNATDSDHEMCGIEASKK